MDETQKKAFDFASDLTKQLITLSTAILTLMVAFTKDILINFHLSSLQRGILVLSWVLYLISICFGLLTYMAITGNLDPQDTIDSKGIVSKVSPTLTLNTPNILSTSKIQIITFFIALILSVFYGFLLII